MNTPHKPRPARLAAVVLAAAGTASGTPRTHAPAAAPPSAPAGPVRRGRWIVPAEGTCAMPVWGIQGGIAVGLWPMPGPRGLLRVYAPYLGHPPGRMINFIAVEPVVGGRRGLSELERSRLDARPGLRMWTADTMPHGSRPALPWQPARPRFIRIGEARALTFYVLVEPFRSGARPILQVILREDRPFEIALRVFTAAGGAKMTACCLTATMGNYARLRRLWLRGGPVRAGDLWPGFRPRGPRLGGFAPHRQWGVDRMVTIGSDAVVAATPDERDPAGAAHDRRVPPGWRYRGRPAVQYWISQTRAGLAVRVNGRRTYWNSLVEIPGGVSFENFELHAPFRAGQEFRFGVAPRPVGFAGVTRTWLESTYRTRAASRPAERAGVAGEAPDALARSRRASIVRRSTSASRS